MVWHRSSIHENLRVCWFRLYSRLYDDTDSDDPRLPRFVVELAEALNRQLARSLECGGALGVACRVAPLSWKGVFEKMQPGYRELAG